MLFRHVITTEKDVDVEHIRAHLAGMPGLGECGRAWDIRPDDDRGTIRCAGEAHDTFARLLAHIEAYCVRIRTEGGEGAAPSEEEIKVWALGDQEGLHILLPDDY